MRYKSVLHNYAESNGLLTAFFRGRVRNPGLKTVIYY